MYSTCDLSSRDLSGLLGGASGEADAYIKILSSTCDVYSYILYTNIVLKYYSIMYRNSCSCLTDYIVMLCYFIVLK